MARIFPFRFHPIFEVTETPVGVRCPVCNEPIREGQLGFLIPCSAVVVDGKVRSLMAEGIEVPWHRLCFLRHVGLPEAELARQAEIELSILARWRGVGPLPS
jgi:hypothetical protein